MRIKPTDKISDFPIFTVRKFLRKTSGFLIDIDFIKYFLKTDDNQKVKSFLDVILENNLIKFEKISRGKEYYIITDNGNTLANATARKPILRSTAEKLINDFIRRSMEVRNNDYFLFKVKQATVFGSYLSNADRIGDIDIAVEIIPKENNSDKHRILVEKRIEDVQIKGRRFKTHLEAIFWPQIEVEQFLRGRSSSISLEYVDQDELEKLNHKIIYRDI